MQLIYTQNDFDNLCQELANESLIAIDTEFCRRRTYYATLSLIQIATKNHRVIVDVLGGIDLGNFASILDNDKITKILHAPDQDLEIFYHHFKKLPRNIFDTQIAASVLGYGPAKSYANLCKDILAVNIDKSLQKADWLQRPLSKQLLAYAISDVEYLLPLFLNLSGGLSARKLWEVYHIRSGHLLQVDNYKINLERVYKKVGMSDEPAEIKENFCHFIMIREECAQRLNLPRAKCASDKQLIMFFHNLPTNDAELHKTLISYTPLIKEPYKTKLLDLCRGLKYNY